MAGSVTKAEIIDAVDALVQALAEFGDTNDCQVELVLDDDGTLSLRTSDEPVEAGARAECFGELAVFESMASLWEYIAGEDKEVAACQDV